MRGSGVCGAAVGRRSRPMLAGYALLAAAVAPVNGAIFTWGGADSATNSGWTDGNNWVGLSAPANNGTAGIVFAATSVVATPSTVDTPYAIQSLTFNSGAPGYGIGGSALLTVGAGGITDNSTQAQTISAPVDLSAAQSWTTSIATGDLTVNGSIGGAGPLTITGPGTITLTNSNTYTGGTTLTGGVLAISNSSGADADLGDPGGALSFNGGTLDVFGPPAGISSRNINVNASGGTLQTDSDFFLAGPITGTGTFNKTGNGDLSILGDNGSTFSGAVNLLRGSVTLYTYGDQPLGTGSANLSGGSALTILDQEAGSPAVPTTITTPLGSAGTFTYGTGGGLLAPTTASTDGGSIFIATLGGNTDGTTANLARAGRGTLIIAPANGTAAANLGVYEKLTVTGTAGNLPTVTNGIVSPTIVGQDDDGNFTGDFLTYNTSAGFVSAAPAYTAGFTGGSTQIANVTAAAVIAANTTAFAVRINGVGVTINPAATLSIGDGTAGHAAGVIFNGTGATVTGGTLAFNGSEAAVYTAQSATINSAITGSNGLTAFGPGTLTLTGTASYTGPTTINGVSQPDTGPAGTLLLSPTGLLSGGGAVAVNPYATFAVRGKVTGAGTVTVDGSLIGDGSITGAVTVNSDGFIAPGFATIPSFLSTGNLSLSTGATAIFDLNAAGADEISVTGTVSLGGATLDVEPTTPAAVTPGSVYVLIANDSTDPVTGTFFDLPQGATFTSPDGVEFAISYTGDSVTHQFAGVGNDVLLQAVSPVPEPGSIVLLSGAGALCVRRRRRSR